MRSLRPVREQPAIIPQCFVGRIVYTPAERAASSWRLLVGAVPVIARKSELSFSPGRDTLLFYTPAPVNPSGIGKSPHPLTRLQNTTESEQLSLNSNNLYNLQLHFFIILINILR